MQEIAALTATCCREKPFNSMAGTAAFPERLSREIRALGGVRAEAQAAALGLVLSPMWTGPPQLDGNVLAYDGARPRGERRADIRRGVATALLRRHGLPARRDAVAELAYELSVSS